MLTGNGPSRVHFTGRGGLPSYRRMKSILLLAAACVLSATPAFARDFCPDRPGIDTPPCTVEPGKLSVEISGADWTHDVASDVVSDTVLLGDLALRYGIAEHAEVRVGWTPFGHSHVRDRQSGAVQNLSGVGDLTIGIKRNLVDPDGKSFSIALLPSVSLPTGGMAIGAGDWGAGLQVPVSVPLGHVVTLLLTPEIDAAVDGDRSGRHLAYGTAGGLGIAASDKLNIAVEGAVMRDDDPGGASTREIIGVAAGLMLGDNTQVDMGSEFGLNHASPDRRVYVGIARRF